MKTPKDIVNMEVPGHPPAKSSRRRIFWVGKKGKQRPIIVSSAEVKSYEKEFEKYVRDEDKVLGEWDGGLCVKIVAWMKDKRQDLDSVPKVLLDLLQAHKVIKNDNRVSELYVKRFIDKEKPRVQITIWAV